MDAYFSWDDQLTLFRIVWKRIAECQDGSITMLPDHPLHSIVRWMWNVCPYEPENGFGESRSLDPVGRGDGLEILQAPEINGYIVQFQRH